MKKNKKDKCSSLLKSVVLATAICGIFLTGCASKENNSEVFTQKVDENEIVVDQDKTTNVIDDKTIETTDESVATEESLTREDLPAVEETGDSGEDTNNEAEDTSQEVNDRIIVWIGDSLTQGSLGRDNDNLDNSPAKRLGTISGHTVEEFGFYGYNTHDIFWVYMDETQKNQKVDPEKIYVFWVGSNDWVVGDVPNCDTQPVIDEIDNIINNAGLEDYIVIGTTSRIELRVDNEDGINMTEAINKDLAEHYNDHYMDVINIIGEDGYGGDEIHLTQESYDAVANALFEKLKTIGYI